MPLCSLSLRTLTPEEIKKLEEGDVVVAQDMKTGKWNTARVSKMTRDRIILTVGNTTWKKKYDEIYRETNEIAAMQPETSGAQVNYQQSGMGLGMQPSQMMPSGMGLGAQVVAQAQAAAQQQQSAYTANTPFGAVTNPFAQVKILERTTV
ncbi:hypothetical protein WR25_22210 [Diploscapter pachys]|uniref:Uncharacterized protein n=1 Tax=Diploscapter pachys TaxID=2018661 RepID=A0A2A2KXX2_9BILA|nr:hypothetical protein WR25_22210 [Diploscapter pachys]